MYRMMEKKDIERLLAYASPKTCKKLIKMLFDAEKDD